MRIGNLRRRITIQQRSTTIDSVGQQVLTWVDVLTSVPADIQSLAGRELLAAQAINAEITHLIEVRYHTLLANPAAVAGWRAVYAGEGVTRIFNLTTAQIVDERNRTIDLLASEGLNQG